MNKDIRAAHAALTERAAAHHAAGSYDLQDECLRCAALVYDLKPSAPATTAGGAGTVDAVPEFNDAMHGAFSAIRNDIDRADMEEIWKGMWRASTSPVIAGPTDDEDRGRYLTLVYDMNQPNPERVHGLLKEGKWVRACWSDAMAERDAARTNVEMFHQGACEAVAEVAELRKKLANANETIAQMRGNRFSGRAATAPVSAASVPGAVQQMANAGFDVAYGSTKVAPVSAVPADERTKFEAWITDDEDPPYIGKDGDGNYHDLSVDHCWSVWQAATLPPSAGAPVSAAEPKTPEIDGIADGQELPAPDYTHYRSYDDDVHYYKAETVRQLLAMRQPQGDDEMRQLLIDALDAGDPAHDLGVELCVRMIAAIKRGGPLPANMVRWAEHMESIAAKQAGNTSAKGK